MFDLYTIIYLLYIIYMKKEWKILFERFFIGYWESDEE